MTSDVEESIGTWVQTLCYSLLDVWAKVGGLHLESPLEIQQPFYLELECS